MINNLSFSHVVLEKKKVDRRGEVLKEMLLKVNKEREGTKYKPMSAKVLAIKLSHLSFEDLCWLKSTCNDYKNRKGSYSKCLFGAIKVARL